MNVGRTIRAALPLFVTRCTDADPFLCVSGLDWSLWLMCPFTMVRSGETIDDDADWSAVLDAVARLTGTFLVDARTPPAGVDPTFVFSDGSEIGLHADTDVDPWTLRLPGVPLIVGQR